MIKRRILVMDDERPVIELVERILKTQGYDVDSVGDGSQALTLVESQAYDLIIADLKMPQMGGMEVYRYIEQHHPEQARRMVFFSGDVISSQTTTFLEQTGRPFLVKPFTVRELLSFVAESFGT
jgi:CheY-like chemotaxis protein